MAQSTQYEIVIKCVIEDAYIRGYVDAIKALNKKRKEQRERKRYFLIQKLHGVALLIITAAAVWLDGDATISFITVPLAFALLFSGEMLIVNDYYFRNSPGL